MVSKLRLVDGHKIIGVGEDLAGPFEIYGELDMGLLTFVLTKDYGTHSWEYRGSVMEFGLCGSWGSGHWSGSFALWKEPAVAEPFVPLVSLDEREAELLSRIAV